MTNQQILEKAIRKAIDGGWKRPSNLDFNSADVFVLYNIDSVVGDRWYTFKIRELLLSHDFAKALWGSKPKTRPFMIDAQTDGECIHPTYKTQRNWQHHLQQMVIADDPIQYLGEHLDD